jgi:tetratricopeptide (TPR) repeat protein
VSSEAYEAYLKGRYFWNKRDADGLKKAIEYFQRAIAVDPGYAAAYSGLADAYALAGGWEYGVLPPQEAAPRAKEAATKAVLLDPDLSEAHTSLAFALEMSTWDWGAAESEYRRALDLNPGYATAHHWYGYHLMTVGRNDEGIAELKLAESLDPLSLIISAGVADALYIAHILDEATRQLHKTLEMDPNFAMAHYQMGQVLAHRGKFDAAIAEFQRAIELSGHSPAFDANLANAYAAAGRTADAERMAKDLAQLQHQNGSVDADIALIYVGLRENDQAMYWLEKAYQARFEAVMLVRPQFDPLRRDPRFRDLMGRLGLGKWSARRFVFRYDNRDAIEMYEQDRIRAALVQHWAASDVDDFETEHSIYRDEAILEYPHPASAFAAEQTPQNMVLLRRCTEVKAIHRVDGARVVLMTLAPCLLASPALAFGAPAPAT